MFSCKCDACNKWILRIKIVVEPFKTNFVNGLRTPFEKFVLKVNFQLVSVFSYILYQLAFVGMTPNICINL